MNFQRRFSLAPALMLSLLGLSSLAHAQVSAVPSALNFQGRMTNPSGNPIPDGTYSVRLSLWDAASAGTEKWNKTVANVQVKNGVFAVTLDAFPANTFNGNLYLEVKIGNDAALTPRTPLLSVPYAMKSDIALTVPDGSLTASKFAAGELTTAVNGLAWLLGGNSGTNPANHFLGTTDNQPLVFKTNNATRLTVNENEIAFTGNLKLDNGKELFLTNNGQIRSGDDNHRLLFRRSENKMELREYGDLIFSPGAIIGTETAKVVMLANGNVGIGTTSPQAKLHIHGGVRVEGNNFIELGGGITKQQDAGKIGYQMLTADALDIIGAGTAGNNRKLKFWNEGGATFTGGATFNGAAQMTGFQMATGAGAGKVLTSDASGIGTWGGLSWNQIANIPGGLGGANNTASGSGAVIAGGYSNTASGIYSSVGGGVSNNARAAGYGAAIAGGRENVTANEYAFVGAGTLNSATGAAAAIVGGSSNAATGEYTIAAGGKQNSASGSYDTVAGGYRNTANGNYAFVGGGFNNRAGAFGAVIAGGRENVTSGENAAIVSGNNNTVSNTRAFIGGGEWNNVSGHRAAVLGGYANYAEGEDSVALGHNAKSAHNGTFVWADQSSPGQFMNTTGPNQFLIRAGGGVGINTNNPAGASLRVEGGVNNVAIFAGDLAPIGQASFQSNRSTSLNYHIQVANNGNTVFYVDGNGRPYGTGGYVSLSDARYKRNVTTVENALDSILNLRGVTYEWDTEKWKERRLPTGKQIGFIAQEVEKVLPELVSTDANGYKMVSYSDAVPVLVEAVKTLNTRTVMQQKQSDAKDAEIAAMKAKNAELEARLSRIEALLQRTHK